MITSPGSLWTVTAGELGLRQKSSGHCSALKALYKLSTQSSWACCHCSGTSLAKSCSNGPTGYRPWQSLFIMAAIDYLLKQKMGFPVGSDGKESACNARGPGSVLRLGRYPGEGNGYPLQCSCLENFMDRGAWWATVHGGRKESNTTEQLTLSLDAVKPPSTPLSHRESKRSASQHTAFPHTPPHPFWKCIAFRDVLLNLYILN